MTEWARPGGAGKELGVSKWGSGAKVSGEGACWAGPAPVARTSHPLSPRTASPTAWAGQGRAGLAWPARQGALARGEPRKVHTHQWEPGGQQ